MNFRSLALAAFLIVGLAGCTHPIADQMETNKLDDVQGTWKVKYSETNGERRSDLAEVAKMRVTINGNLWILAYNNQTGDRQLANLIFDPAWHSDAVDFDIRGPDGRFEPVHAIYELKGDVLRFCFADESKERPTSFESKSRRGGHWLLALEHD